jgi:IclR family acetate operon transcriptional repressor
MEARITKRQGPSAPTGAQAIERALDVLGCFLGAEPELGNAEIARRLGLTPSTVHRMVRALANAGYLEQNPNTERYRLGRSAVLLGAVAQHVVGLDLAVPILGQVADATGESVNFVVLDGDAGVITHRVETKNPLRFAQPVGTRVGLHCSASGKAMLAFHPEGNDAVRRMRRLAGHTEHTITSRAALERELKLIRERGYSLDEQETQLGVRCIAAPLLDASQHAYAAVGVQIPTVRIAQEKLPELAPVVVDAVKRIRGLIPAAHLT